jgi:3' exoribonuclease, RNase T-like
LNHLMVDIETLGTRPGSAILSIGAVVFDEKKILREWECNIDLKSSMDRQLTVEADTICWWMRQSAQAINDTFNQISATNVHHALENLRKFTVDERCKWFWSHGATFDLVMLTEAALKIGAPVMVQDFRFARDTRTLYEIAGVNPKNFMGTGTAHKAIDDARAQALAVIESWRVIRKWQNSSAELYPQPETLTLPPMPNVGGVA